MATVTRVLPWRRAASRPASLEIAELLRSYDEHHPGATTDLIERSFAVAAKAHEGQMRKSGEPYIRHPVAVATIVARQGLDDVTVAGALLHDAVEDTQVALNDIETDFGSEVARIVDGVTKLERVHYDSKEQQQAASMRKMIVAIAQDIRVLIIKLADRLHNLRHDCRPARVQAGANSPRNPRRVRTTGPSPGYGRCQTTARGPVVRGVGAPSLRGDRSDDSAARARARHLSRAGAG